MELNKTYTSLINNKITIKRINKCIKNKNQ